MDRKHTPRPWPAVGVGALAFALTLAGATAPASAEDEHHGPRNVIYMIGDGLGHNQVDAASLYQYGEANHQIQVDPATGEVEHLPGTPTQVYQHFDLEVAMSTYWVESSYDPELAWADFDYVKEGWTDSAAAGTAMATGIKTYNAALGVDVDRQPVVNLSERAQTLGKATGVVSDVPFSHATPAAFVVHNEDRNNYHEIAHEMVHSSMNVIIGAGHPSYDNSHDLLEAPDYEFVSEQTWSEISGGRTDFTFVESTADLRALATAEDTPAQVIGVPQVASTLQYERAMPEEPESLPYETDLNDVPSLAELSLGALNVLHNASDEGLFLMIEGGAIDWASHANDTVRVIEETVAFNHAIEAVVAWVEAESSWEETLVVVTADHETGYLAGDGADPSWTPMTGASGELPAVSWHSGDHTNMLVPFYAHGAASDALAALATGTDPVRGAYLDNTTLARLLLDELWPEPQEPEPPRQPMQYGFFLTNGWGGGDADYAFQYGRHTDEVLVGDWNGDGHDTITVRRGDQFFVNNAARGGPADTVFSYGRPDDIVLVGDWDGDGTDTLAVRRGATYHVKNSLHGGAADHVITYGRDGDVVLVGDWDGSGTDTFALRRGATYHVRNSLRGGDADVVLDYGREGDVVLAGDWDGDGADTFAVRRGHEYHVKNSLRGGPADRVMFYGREDDEVYVGDWDGDGMDTIGVRRTP